MAFSQPRFEAAYRTIELCRSRPAVNLPPGGLHVFDSLPSTNQTAWDLLQSGAPTGTTVIALQQTAGRGQWGRQWASAPGGLYLSTTVIPNLVLGHAAQLTICSAWGIATALREIPAQLSGVNHRIPVQVKWLNDLVLNGRKLGGILTETRIQQGRIARAVIGVGINWTNPVPEPGITLQSYLKRQPTPLLESLEMLAAITLHGLFSGYDQWQKQGIEALLPSYLELLTHRDRPIPVDGKAGMIVGITAIGELRIRLLQPDSATNSEILLKPGTISLGYEPSDSS